MHKRVSLRVGIITVFLSFILLFTLAACTRSKSGPVPTLAVTSQAQISGTPTAGATVVTTGETTPTPEGDETATVTVPTMTPTPETGGEPTATPSGGQELEPTATPAAEEPTATPTTGTEFEYVVKTGDTLWGLAIRFGTTVEAIKARNNLTDDTIYKGQKLIISGTEGGETVTHVVQPGENLFRISLKYGTTVEAIAAANGIVNPQFIYVGQQLLIPSGSTAPSGGVRYHVVQPGENLWSIAMKYNTTPWKIAAANGISNINFIYAGRTLRIP